MKKRRKTISVLFATGWGYKLVPGELLGGTIKTDVLLMEYISHLGVKFRALSFLGKSIQNRIHFKLKLGREYISYSHYKTQEDMVHQLLKEQTHYDLVHLSSKIIFNDPVLLRKIHTIKKPIIWTVTSNSIFPELIKKNLKVCSKIVCKSEKLKSDLVAMGIEEDCLVVIKNAIIASKEKKLPKTICLKYRQKYTIDKKAVVFTVAGRISPEKRLDFLVKSWIKFKKKKIAENTYLFILGKAAESNNEMQKFQQKIKKMKKYNIIAPGWVDIAPYLSMSDFTVSASCIEGLSNVALEAASRETPNIGPIQTPGYTDIIINNKTGFLYDLHDEEELIQTLYKATNLRRKSPRKYFHMAKQARILIKEKCSYEVASKEYYKLYKELVYN